MGTPLLDDIWTRRGVSLLWDADALAALCEPSQVLSLRRFLLLHRDDWSNVESLMVDNEATVVTLVVGGLESAIDALPPEDACEWLEQVVYPAIVSYQREVAGGGAEAALVLWLADHRRLDYHTSDDTYHWHCGTEYKGQQIPLGRCLFNGAQRDVRRIQVAGDKKTDHWVGLFHPRVCS